jgi:murein DD-endopeptidase MepM/ murein hydrolase activator NlpD
MKHLTRNLLTACIALSILVGSVIVFIRYDSTYQKRHFAIEVDTLVEKKVSKLYDIPVDSFVVVFDKVRHNQILSAILSNFRLPDGSLSQLIANGNKKFDLRKIRAGNKYTAFLKKDSVSTLRYLVYEITPIDYVRFSFGDSLTIELGKKEVVQQRKFASGTIQTSLWNAVRDRGVNPMLASELSEIYAWSIDFFGLQPADSFAVVYDEQFVDSVPVDLGRIYVAFFRHEGNDFYAIPFVQDSIESYFDIDGKSLRKAFLKAPLRFSRISSRFSESRFHPILRIRRPHHGVDYSAPSGTPVEAIGDGKIIMANHGYNGGGGNVIKIRHNSIYTTSYMHLSRFAAGINAGKVVKQGDIIGYVGMTGLATGPHLDFRVYKFGEAVDPLKIEAPPVDPVHDENRVAFDSVKAASLRLFKMYVN